MEVYYIKLPIENSRLLLVFGIIFAILFSIIFLKYYFKPVSTYNSFYKAVDFLASKPEEATVMISGLPENTCFWVTPSHNGVNYTLVIREYDSPTKNCIGKLIQESEIVIENPINIMGDTSCICGGKKYLIEKMSEGGLTSLNILIK
jgi:hypothetical protein